jgi:hypothetical protein
MVPQEVPQEVQDRLKDLETRYAKAKAYEKELMTERRRHAVLLKPDLHIDEYEEYDQKHEEAVEASMRAVKVQLRLFDEIIKLKREHGIR